jgi:hypothetical protein
MDDDQSKSPASSKKDYEQAGAVDAIDGDHEKGAVAYKSHDSDSRLDAYETEVKLDSYGIPLSPQPSRFKDDPLVSLHRFWAGARNRDTFIFMYWYHI